MQPNEHADRLHNLETTCRTRWGISVTTYRLIKSLTAFVGVMSVSTMWALSDALGAEVAALIIGGIIFGGEFVTAHLAEQGARMNDETNE